MWRLVVARITTLREIEEWWCLDDLLQANRALDVAEEVERLRYQGG